MTTSAEAKAELIQAREQVEVCTHRLAEVMADCVNVAARQLPDRLDALAKVFVTDDPDVTLDLGIPGIEQVRLELAGVAWRVGNHLRSAVDELGWDDEHGADITRSVGTFLTNRVIPDVKSVLADAGYTRARHLRANPANGNAALFGAQQLPLCEPNYPPLGDAFGDLAHAEHAVSRARQSYQLVRVEEVWAGSSPSQDVGAQDR